MVQTMLLLLHCCCCWLALLQWELYTFLLPLLLLLLAVGLQLVLRADSRRWTIKISSCGY
jgi:hypothetical protein